jgi:hypothetical protein
MKAILVKYHGPGNVKGSRFTAKAEGVPSLTRHYDHAIDADTNAFRAAVDLADRHNWLKDGRLVGGTLPNGDRCFVFIGAKGAL